MTDSRLFLILPLVEKKRKNLSHLLCTFSGPLLNLPCTSCVRFEHFTCTNDEPFYKATQQSCRKSADITPQTLLAITSIASTPRKGSCDSWQNQSRARFEACGCLSRHLRGIPLYVNRYTIHGMHMSPLLCSVMRTWRAVRN